MITKGEQKCKYEKVREDLKPFSDDCVMIIVPHQDDEVLMTGGIIERFVSDGIKVKVVITTNGDTGDKTFNIGQTRMRESLVALEYLGLSSENVIFLGYADTGMFDSESFLYRLYNSESATQIYSSSCSTQTYGLDGVSEDYHYKVSGKHAPYTRESFINDLISVIKEYMPKHIFVTSEFDMHGDHKALCWFTKDAVKSIRNEFNRFNPCIHQGIVHSTAGDTAWPLIDEDNSPVAAFTMPSNLEEVTSLRWEDREIFAVPEDMLVTERAKNRKHIALLKYKSAFKPEEPEVIKYLLSFVKSDEVFWEVKIIIVMCILSAILINNSALAEPAVLQKSAAYETSKVTASSDMPETANTDEAVIDKPDSGSTEEAVTDKPDSGSTEETVAGKQEEADTALSEEVESDIDYVDSLKRLGLLKDESDDKELVDRNAIIRFQSCCNMMVDGKWADNCMTALKKILNSDVYTYPDIVKEPPTNKMWITINKTKRILTLYLGDTVLEKYPVAVGNPPTLTPDGKFKIVNKVVNPSWGGGGYAKPIKGGIPENPLGYRWMGLSYKNGGQVGIHGNSSPYSIGKNISHGCIRMINSDVEDLFGRVPLSTEVWIGDEKKLNSWGVYQPEYK